ncbi:MAG: TIGR04133 family radical SAM/SPASM protein [Bacteroidales bacterium]|nr:TIGR04133 family radical SAM/SPASM protein [Bacteroidales bacterium]MDD4214757.1 TIGR04133 family radical SAM/SPASM protein [Bacteroidales bacterium]
MKNYRPGLRKRVALNVFSKYTDVQAKLHELTYFFWECTLRCNINCQHCGSDCYSEPSVKDMPYQDFLKVTERVKEVYDPHKVMIVITGGEPLMRKDLEDCGMELYKQGFPWGFVTNGYALTAERFKHLLNSGLRSMTISLDGFQDSHNWLRGNKQSFEKAVNAIKLAVGAGDHIVFDVVTCINQKNFNELHELKKLLIELGVKRWRIFSICPIGRAKENSDLQITNVQFRCVLDFIKANRQEGIIQTSFGCEGFLGSYESEVRDGFFFCRAGINVASVLADGSICACPNIDRSSFIQGNICKDDFIEVWNNRFEKMRDRKWTKEGLCADCKEWKWCKGNGIHLRNVPAHDVLRCHYKMIQEEY